MNFTCERSKCSKVVLALKIERSRERERERQSKLHGTIGTERVIDKRRLERRFLLSPSTHALPHFIANHSFFAQSPLPNPRPGSPRNKRSRIREAGEISADRSTLRCFSNGSFLLIETKRIPILRYRGRRFVERNRV